MSAPAPPLGRSVGGAEEEVHVAPYPAPVFHSWFLPRRLRRAKEVKGRIQSSLLSVLGVKTIRFPSFPTSLLQYICTCIVHSKDTELSEDELNPAKRHRRRRHRHHPRGAHQRSQSVHTLRTRTNEVDGGNRTD